MEKMNNKNNKKLDAVFAGTLVGVLDKMNDLKIIKEDVVNIFQNNQGQYVAIFYY